MDRLGVGTVPTPPPPFFSPFPFSDATEDVSHPFHGCCYNSALTLSFSKLSPPSLFVLTAVF